MTTVIFVYGTGVREPQYTQTFKEVSQALSKGEQTFTVLPCYWGGEYGTRLHANGASIPQYDTSRVDESVTLWELLYQDPLYELRLLSLRTTQKAQFVPGQLPPGDTLHEQTQKLTQSLQADEVQILEQSGITMPILEEASTTVMRDAAFHDALLTAPPELDEYRSAIGRAIVAQAIVLFEDKALFPPIATDAALRDQVTDTFTKRLGSSTRGIVTDWLKKQLLGLGTKYIKAWRGSLTDKSVEPIGDILFYQSSGKPIRQFICDKITSVQGPVVLLAHSLGGIASVELLAEADKSVCEKVKLLVTVGSQAPYFYELNALQTLPFQDIPVDQRLPAHFPDCLNIYDMRDFLSYIGAGLFGNRVTDKPVDNRQPFPHSHCAYWTNNEVWDVILNKIKKICV